LTVNYLITVPVNKFPSVLRDLTDVRDNIFIKGKEGKTKLKIHYYESMSGEQVEMDLG